MSIPKKAEKRIKVPRTYDIYADQIEWLDNSSLNKSKKIRELLDNFINEVDATVIQNLKDEIKEKDNEIRNYIQIKLRRIKELKEQRNQIRELMATIEEQKTVIVALGGEE